MLTSEALLLCHLSQHPYLQPHPGGPQEETSDHWWAAIQRRHCTAAESLRWCSVVLVLTEHTQDTTYYVPYWWQCQLRPLLMTMSTKSQSQTERTDLPANRLPLHPSTNPMWTLALRALIRTASGKGGGRKLRLRPPRECGMDGYRSWDFLFFINAVIDEDEDDNWWCYESPFWFETTWQGCRPRLLS